MMYRCLTFILIIGSSLVNLSSAHAGPPMTRDQRAKVYDGFAEGQKYLVSLDQFDSLNEVNQFCSSYAGYQSIQMADYEALATMSQAMGKFVSETVLFDFKKLNGTSGVWGWLSSADREKHTPSHDDVFLWSDGGGPNHYAFFNLANLNEGLSKRAKKLGKPFVPHKLRAICTNIERN